MRSSCCFTALALCSASASFATGEASMRTAPAASAAATAAAATAAAAAVPAAARRTDGPKMGGGGSPASSSPAAAAAAAAAAFAGSSISNSDSNPTGGDDGACNEGDRNYTEREYDSILTDMKLAVIGCAMVPTTACFDYNLKKSLGEFSAPCMGCWDDFGLCWQKSCVYSCLSEGVSDGCKRCLNGHCYSSLRSCTGIDCDHLPGCSDDRGSSAAAASPLPAAAGAPLVAERR
jgi:hypothetical protein